jgi:hypothetical protein
MCELRALMQNHSSVEQGFTIHLDFSLVWYLATSNDAQSNSQFYFSFISKVKSRLAVPVL